MTDEEIVELAKLHIAGRLGTQEVVLFSRALIAATRAEGLPRMKPAGWALMSANGKNLVFCPIQHQGPEQAVAFYEKFYGWLGPYKAVNVYVQEADEAAIRALAADTPADRGEG